MHWLWMGIYHGVAMFWETLWALVLGLGISAALQVFVSKEKMSQRFGRTNLKTMLLATGFGAASSSCSYAAVAAGRSAFQQGAALIPALAFMFASTNLVVELGAVLWVLMGWHFVLAEVIGAFVLIGLMWLLMSIFFPKNLEEEARRRAEAATEESAHDHHIHMHEGGGRWTRLANAFWADWMMLWKEIIGGFLIAGFVAALVPGNWWEALFLNSGPSWLRLIENAAVGPLVAVASFVCSVGNIPLASLLWAHGISFGGVISFIYADLIVVPIILIYRKYYGGRAALYITLIFYVAMVVAGVIVDLAFKAAGLIPHLTHGHGDMSHAVLGWNYTPWLDLAAIVVGLALFAINWRATRTSPSA